MKFHLLCALLILPVMVWAQKNSIPVKTIDQSLVRLSEVLYVCSHQTTNAQYQAFLTSLMHDQRMEEYQVAQIQPFDSGDSIPPLPTNYHTDKRFAEYPVVNISYRGAIMFCNWLTTQYNSTQRGKFRKVKFRLPTEEEWMLAAHCGNPETVYPWEGISLKDERGDYRANFNTGEDAYIEADSSQNQEIPIRPVISYSPNSLGLYNMAGNVSEMTATEGVCKGGSWRDSEKAMRIDSNGSCYSASPYVGFRYFMEVQEE